MVTAARMETFLAVARHGSVRRAAAQLHITEAAVSAAVAHVEKQLGAKLVAKAGRGIALTEAGRVYAEYCRGILGLMQEAQAAVRRAETGRLRIGVVATAGEYILLRPLASFRRRFPDIELSLSVHPRDALFLELQHHETDLVIAGRPPRDTGLVVRARRPSSLVVVGLPELDPLHATWLLRGRGSGTREATLGLLDQLRIEPPTLTLGSHGAVLAAAREGLGVTLIHSDAISQDLDNGVLRVLPVDGTPLDRPWHAVTTRTPTPTTRLFLAHLLDAAEAGSAAFHPH
ncbi:LysR substrate-binding domain-containing protein [Nocardia implantans]|uniref:LysR substrate-binding domain-containing protein n=1 Tax=Nocardia implantans TaxID=3108168 RepID=A0ABU6AX52_9NOCA|nr:MULTISPECIES: LysR substrate-binding domain-containing protein [unclassified Nocardia]MEA3529483.1 LysR substrate-binding domain-containing protein [Nocardia sp. CDC192]MEB3512069.1 LysR substrate-binding domain-containing protein [Nocardia sp. CDC186]